MTGEPPSFEAAVEEGLRELDDTELLDARAFPSILALVDAEIANRKRFEAMWSGRWQSGTNARIPRQSHRKGPSMSREALRRQEYAKLIHQSQHGPVAQRRAALYILQTCYGK